MGEKIKVVYIRGWGRSGSTLLSNILGQIEGLLSIGEIRMIWEDGFIQNKTCECGHSFLECELWKRVTDYLVQRIEKVQADRWNRLYYYEARTLHAPKFFLPGGPPFSPALREYLSITGKLYEAIQQTSQCSVVVDSSKSPFYGRLLQLIPQMEVYTLHLIRDPR